MNRLLASLLAATAAMCALVSTQAAAAPATKVDFPEKGKIISLVVPFTAGGGTDIAARLLAPLLEKEIGVSVQVVNKPGAGSQRGLSEVVKSKPDGYTISYVIIPTVLPIYLDPDRQAIFSRTDFVPLAGQYDLGYCIAVHRDSPYKTLNDLIAAAKAKPGIITNGTTGVMALGHIATLQFQKTVDIKFALVHFEGSGPQITALAGQHVDVIFTGEAELLPHYKAGTMRVLALLQREDNPDYPGVKTAAALGYPAYQSSVGVIVAPKGTPQGVVDVLSNALGKVINSDEHHKRMKDVGFPVTYKTPQEVASFWADDEAELRPLIQEALRNK